MKLLLHSPLSFQCPFFFMFVFMYRFTGFLPSFELATLTFFHHRCSVCEFWSDLPPFRVSARWRQCLFCICCIRVWAPSSVPTVGLQDPEYHSEMGRSEESVFVWQHGSNPGRLGVAVVSVPTHEVVPRDTLFREAAMAASEPRNIRRNSELYFTWEGTR
jgi:hypothetical protein